MNFYIRRKNVWSIADLNEEEQQKDHVENEHENVEEKESNVQLKSQRGFFTLPNDAVFSVNNFFYKTS